MTTPLPVIADHFLVFQTWFDAVELHPMGNRFCVKDNSLSATPQQVADRVALSFANALMPLAASSITMGQTNIIPLDGSTATSTWVTPSAGTVGGHTSGNATPNDSCVTVAWQSGFRGKSKRGRSFLFHPQTDQVGDARTLVLTTGALSAWQTNVNAFLSDLASGTPAPSLTLMVLSRKLGTSVPVIQARVDQQVHVQRRRLERVARH
jgi:hypothetical protein